MGAARQREKREMGWIQRGTESVSILDESEKTQNKKGEGSRKTAETRAGNHHGEQIFPYDRPPRNKG